jgi:hypothetical protein
VYSVALQAGEVVEASLDVSSPWSQSALYMARDCINPVTSCITGTVKSTRVGPLPPPGSMNGAIKIGHQASVAETVYIYVDNVFDFDDFPYTFRVQISAPTCTTGGQSMCYDMVTAQTCTGYGLYDYEYCSNGCMAGACL